MSLKERARQSYYDQLKRCNNPRHPSFKWYGAKGIKVEYGLNEFREWYLKNAQTFKRPTVDRKDHLKNYSMENIQIVEKSDNSKERIKRAGTPLAMKPIIMMTKNGFVFLKEFESAYHAAREINGLAGSIYHVLNKRRLSHKGYSFKYKE